MIPTLSHQVIVCGGGPAGVAAALASARAGADTALIELTGCLGGVWTSGLLSNILDVGNKTGLLPEIIDRLDSLHEAASSRDQAWDVPWVRGAVLYDAELMKIALEGLCLEARVRVRLHTRVCAARVENRRLLHIETESKSGREVWTADQFLDCTGDGDLGAQAGCSWEYGSPGDNRGQPMTLMCLVGGPSAEQMRPYLHGAPGAKNAGIEALRTALADAGFTPSYGMPLLLPVHDGLYALMANHEYGASGLHADDLTRATLHARQELYQLVRALNRLGGPFARLRLVATANQIGVRESRRLAGKYRLTRDDLLEGRSQPDAVCRVTFPVDVHSLDKSEGTTFDNRNLKSKPYDIPLRALESSELDNLLFAGRCISGDFFAHASYRVTGNAVPMGEAAGREAARRIAVKATLAPVS